MPDKKKRLTETTRSGRSSPVVCKTAVAFLLEHGAEIPDTGHVGDAVEFSRSLLDEKQGRCAELLRLSPQAFA